ncbi:hypothetical protein JCM3770_005829 [Rhodotorula araucariae]
MSPSPEPAPARADSEHLQDQAGTTADPPAEAVQSQPTLDSPRGDDGSRADREPADSPQDAWQAVFSQDANAWYFWNAHTGETTWSNPRDAASSSDAAAGPSAAPASAAATDPNALPEIDPDLVWLDPSLAARKSGVQGAQAARFNARTGRFTADPGLTPDRISQFQRGQRQQEAYYDVQGWEQQLAGRGIKRAGEPDEADDAKKRPSAKQVEKFRQQKEEKRRKKLNAWLT